VESEARVEVEAERSSRSELEVVVRDDEGGVSEIAGCGVDDEGAEGKIKDSEGAAGALKDSRRSDTACKGGIGDVIVMEEICIVVSRMSLWEGKWCGPRWCAVAPAGRVVAVEEVSRWWWERAEEA
jgi:hypothetical protein